MKKLLLLVFSMTLVLFFTSNAFAQKGVVKVASNQELIKALDDPTVKTIEIAQAGFYDAILLDAPSGTILEKGKDGDRALDCVYWIQPADVCFDPDNQPAGVTPGFVADTARAGTVGGAGICPADNSGAWVLTTKPAGSIVILGAAPNMYVMPFQANMPGQYIWTYTWAAEATVVETDYFFYDIPVITDLHANPDTVCGLATTITFNYDMGFTSPDTTVVWTVNGADSSAVFPFEPGTFGFNVTQCGSYEVNLHVENSLGCGDSDSTIYLYFYDNPIANAGMDDEICGFVYEGLNGTYTGALCDAGVTPTEAWSYISGPDASPVFSAGMDSVTVTMCGAYEFLYTVTNGLCVDSDTVAIYFYDTPIIAALVDDTVCGLNALLAGSYTVDCDNGGTVMEYWSLVSGAGTATFNGLTDVDVSDCGAYTFQYKVVNGLCSDSATVDYYFLDTPVVDAGPDADVCGLTYTLTPSYTVECNNGVTPFEEWTMVSGPPSGIAMFAGNVVTVDSCGVYVFQYKVTNDLCADSATVEISFFDTPVITMMPDDTVCGLTATIWGNNTVKCTNGVDVKWTKTAGPTGVTFTPDDTDTTVVTVDTCGQYTFTYTVTNGPCVASGSVNVYFAAEPVIVFDAGYPVPEKVCGFESDEFFVDFTATCDVGSSAEWTTDADSIIETSPNMFTAYVDTCGTYWFTYTVTNGPCVVDTTVYIEFYETPEPEIIGDTLVYACSTVEYCVTDLGSCNPLDSLEFAWELAGGLFDNGLSTATGECVNVDWDNQFDVWGQIIVVVNIKGLPDCSASDTLDVWRMQPTLEGQVKYWNAVETYMPTPYATDDYNTIPFDYFYVTLYLVNVNAPDGLAPLETVYVQPRLMEDLNELMSYFDFELNTIEYGCDAEYVLKVWDGGMVYHTTPPAPFEETKLGGSTYTYNNWGGVNATDALAIQLMVGGATDLQGLGYNWVGMQSYIPQYGYYSHGIADVNSTNTYVNGGITALDALTAKYRAVGLLGSYPHNGAGMNQFTPNFRVTGRMVPALPHITFPTPFDYPNVDDVPFTHSGTDYMYFSLAVDHKYTSIPIPWEGDANYINLYYESIGDINASYIPPGSGLKAEPTVELTYEGMFGAYVGEELTIPVSVDRDAEVGAITLSFNYRNDLIEVLGTNYSDDDMFINQEEGILNMAWFSTEARELIADAAVAQIKIRILEEIPEGTELFSLNVNTELADATANPIDVDLKTIGISTDKGIDVTALTSSNYPNPFSDATTISYVLPESGSVKIDVYNNMGMLVTTLVDEAQDSGVQNVVFNSSAAQAGVYFYHITVQGETNNYSAVKRMIVVN